MGWWGGGGGRRGEYIYLTCFKTLGSSSKRGMEKGGRREGMVEGRGRDKDGFCSHTCSGDYCVSHNSQFTSDSGSQQGDVEDMEPYEKGPGGRETPDLLEGHSALSW